MKALACAAVALSLINAAMAADYVVGNPGGGWDGRTDYKSWAAAQAFAPGDTLSKCHQLTLWAVIVRCIYIYIYLHAFRRSRKINSYRALIPIFAHTTRCSLQVQLIPQRHGGDQGRLRSLHDDGPHLLRQQRQHHRRAHHAGDALLHLRRAGALPGRHEDGGGSRRPTRTHHTQLAAAAAAAAATAPASTRET